MQEWPDDKLDAFFRKSAEEQDPEYSPQEWDKLRKRLDQGNGAGAPWWKRHLGKGLVLSALMIIGALVSLWYTPEKETSLTLKEKHTPSLTDSRTPPEEVQKTNRALSEPKKWSRQKNRGGGAPSEPGVWGTNRTDGTYLISQKGKKVYYGESIHDTLAKVSSIKRPSPVQADVSENLNKTAKVQASVSLDYLNSKKIEIISGAAFSTPEIAFPTVSATSPPIITINRERRWSIRASLGPDFSAAKISHFSTPTFSWAAHLEYRLSRRIWLQSGYVKSAKQYSALPGYYSWPGNWQQDVLPQSIDAICNMTEIPINLKYILKNGGNTAWYASLGATNYKMQNEKYQYNYERPDPSIKWYKWEGATGWYWMSHLNASVGYERVLNDNWRIGIEPFVKIPTRKVGFGNVNLYTAGAWLYISYGR